jgi:hypothetical protein
LEGQRNTRKRLWTVDLQDNNSRPSRDGQKGGTTSLQVDGVPQATLNPYEAHSIYECTNKRDLVRFLHAAAFSPVQDTWLKAIRAGHFTTWPGLTEDNLMRKHLPKEIATVKVHLSQRRKNLRSTTTTGATHVTPASEPDNNNPTSKRTKCSLRWLM